MEALMLMVDICAMFLLVRWSAKTGVKPPRDPISEGNAQRDRQGS